MMRCSRSTLLYACFVCLALLSTGCQRQKQGDTSKTYTSDVPAKQGGDNSGGQSDAKPLDAPADTTNGRSSKASDSGTSSATQGQVVAEPGAPVEHDAQQKPPKAPPSGGHS